VFTLFPDQQVVVEKLREAYRTHNSVLCVAPTGWGKTVLFSHITQANHARGRSVVIAVHRIELVNQVRQTLSRLGVPHGVLSPGHPVTDHPVQVASIFTLARRVNYLPRPYLLIVDEAHHAIPTSTWGKVMTLWRNSKILGVTATPIRLSGEGLGDLFQAIVQGPSAQELIEMGRLSPFRVFAPPTIDTLGLHLQGGDYKTKELEARVNKKGLTGDVVAHYASHAAGKRAIAFCVSVQHAHDVASRFRDAGFSAVAVDGGIPAQIRDNAIGAFRRNEVSILSSCDLVSEGFDVPGVDCGILLRPTASMGLYLQQLGRCLRVAAGKSEAIILDHAGNVQRHGWPTEDRQWTLERTRERREQKEKPSSIRVCPQCFAASRSGTTQCRECGHVFKPTPREVEQREGKLEELRREHVKKQTKIEQARADTLEALTTLGIKRGYHPLKARKWAEHIFNHRRKKRSITLRGTMCNRNS
jgi:superfamily II DNA or RNA helicase